jgi:hypothetical protein
VLPTLAPIKIKKVPKIKRITNKKKGLSCHTFSKLDFMDMDLADFTGKRSRIEFYGVL